MGAWFVAVGFGGGLIGGVVASLYDANAGQDFLFGLLTMYCLASAVVLAFLVKPIKNLLNSQSSESVSS